MTIDAERDFARYRKAVTQAATAESMGNHTAAASEWQEAEKIAAEIAKVFEEARVQAATRARKVAESYEHACDHVEDLGAACPDCNPRRM